MLCKNNMANPLIINPRCEIQNTKIFLVLKNFYYQKQKAHIMLNEQYKAMHDSA